MWVILYVFAHQQFFLYFVILLYEWNFVENKKKNNFASFNFQYKYLCNNGDTKSVIGLFKYYVQRNLEFQTLSPSSCYALFLYF